MTAATGIAGLLASGRIEGDVRLEGTVTRLDLHRTRAGHDWAVPDLDDGTGTLEVQVAPRPWLDARRVVRVGARVVVSGRLNAVADGLQVLGQLVEERS